MACPFCRKRNECAHLLLLVDSTFRTAEGGRLMTAFNQRWLEAMDGAGPDADESIRFDELLDEARQLADATVSSEHAAWPGMSSAYETLYVRTPETAKSAIDSLLGKRGEKPCG